MEYETSEPMESHARGFVLAGRRLAGALLLDGKGQELGRPYLLVEVLWPCLADPDAAITRIVSLQQAQSNEVLTKTALLRHNGGDDRFTAFPLSVDSLRSDGYFGRKRYCFSSARPMLAIPTEEVRRRK